MKQNLFLLLICFNFHLIAQSSRVWEAELVYQFDLSAREKNERAWGDRLATALHDPRISTLKHFNAKILTDPDRIMTAAKRDFMVEDLLQYAALHPERCYRDMELTQKYPPEELQKKWITLKPARYVEEGRKEDKLFLGRYEFYAFRIRQRFYYDPDTGEFGAQLLALAPVVKLFNDGVLSTEELFWFAPGQFKAEELYLNNPQLNIVKIINYQAPMRRFEMIQPLEVSISEKIVEDAREGRLSVYENCQALQKTEIDRLTAPVDSVTTFDPLTYEPVNQVLKNEKITAKVSHIRFIQYFYYDQEHCRMAVQLLSLQPLQDLYTDKKYVGQSALFYVPGQIKR